MASAVVEKIGPSVSLTFLATPYLYVGKGMTDSTPETPAITAHHAKVWTEDVVGAVLGGRFEVEKRIGRGGMAEVCCSTGWRR